ncbi:MAG TPA: ABC transporter permease subunit [Blastocatellia bacterium]|nr:ABC transporter permease subunit [Blastocatellia bacterium]
MLWYRHWLETRWRFFIGLALLVAFSAMMVLTEPLVGSALENFQDPGGRIGEFLREQVETAKTYDGYVWQQWFSKNLLMGWILLATLIGVGGIVTESSRGTALFTLSLPVTRRRLLAVRAATGAIELALLALVPSLLIPLFSLAIGESYSLAKTIVYVLLTILGGAVFYALSILLSTIFSDQMKPIIIGIAVAFILSTVTIFFKEFAPYSILNVMSGGSYFRTGELPWLGLAISLALAGAMFYLSLRIVERRDF